MIEIHKKDKLINKLLPDQKIHPDRTYSLSQFVYSAAVGESEYALYNTLTKQGFALPYAPDPDRVYSCAEIEADGELSELLKGYFLSPVGTDECAFYNKLSMIARAFKRSGGYRAYTVLPTFACNARCVYCYEEGTEPKSMSVETARAVVEFIKQTRRKDGYVYLLWFGGEPLLRPDMIDEICVGLKNSGVDFYSGIVTNGSLINDDIIRRMKDCWNIGSVQISMDGAEPDYRQRKNYYVYNNTYSAVIASVGKLSAAGIPAAVRLNVDLGNVGDVPVVLNDLASAVQNKEFVSVQLAPLYGVRMSEDDIAMWKKVMELNPLISEAGFRTVNLANLDRSFRVFRCMSDNPYGNVLIMPDGRLSTCQQYPAGSVFGDIWHGTTDPAALKAFTAADSTREKCKSCVFLPDCTSFANCPVQDFHCKEMRMMKAQLMLEDMYKKAAASGAQPEEEPEDDPLSHITTSD